MMEDVYNTVGAVPREDVSFENVIKPLIDLEGEVANKRWIFVVSSLKNTNLAAPGAQAHRMKCRTACKILERVLTLGYWPFQDSFAK